MKIVYKVTNGNKPDLYFGTLKKAHNYLIANKHTHTNVTNSFAQFKRWIVADGAYQTNMADEWCFVIEVS